MSIKAKFRCRSVTTTYVGVEVVKFVASNGTSETANSQWTIPTPSGTLELYVGNPDTHKHFIPGKYYSLVIVETTEDA